MQTAISESLVQALSDEEFKELAGGYLASHGLDTSCINGEGQLALTLAGSIAAYITRREGSPFPYAFARMPEAALADPGSIDWLLTINAEQDRSDGGCFALSEADDALLYCSSLPLVGDRQHSFNLAMCLFTTHAIHWDTRIRSRLNTGGQHVRA